MGFSKVETDPKTLINMKVTISGDALDIVVTDGRISKFTLNGKEDVGKFRKGLTSLVRVLDDMMVETLSVCHLNLAIERDDNATIKKYTDQIESGMYLYCNCSNCLLGYLRTSIIADRINDQPLRERLLRTLARYNDNTNA